MKAFYYGVSLATLISLFVLGPAFGRAILLRVSKRKRLVLHSTQHVALGFCTMTAIFGMLVLYGLLWKANPKLALWYDWMADVPISGSVTVDGGVEVTNEPLKVEIAR